MKYEEKLKLEGERFLLWLKLDKTPASPERSVAVKRLLEIERKLNGDTDNKPAIVINPFIARTEARIKELDIKRKELIYRKERTQNIKQYRMLFDRIQWLNKEIDKNEKFLTGIKA